MSVGDDRSSQGDRILLIELDTINCLLCCFCEHVQTFNLTSAMIFLSCRIQRNLAHQILALAFKMFMAASAALCFASFLLVPSPELRLKKKKHNKNNSLHAEKMWGLHRGLHSTKQSHCMYYIYTLGNKNIHCIQLYIEIKYHKN